MSTMHNIPITPKAVTVFLFLKTLDFLPKFQNHLVFPLAALSLVLTHNHMSKVSLRNLKDLCQ